MKDAVAGMIGAVGLPVLVAPCAPAAEVEPVDGHGQPAWREPPHEHVRIGVSAEEELAWCAELPGDHDLRHSWFGDEACSRHHGFLSVGRQAAGLPRTAADARPRGGAVTLITSSRLNGPSYPAVLPG